MQGYVGEIKCFAGTFAPRNWLACKGQQLNIYEYQVLYSIVGNRYGGDGHQTFALPNIAPLLGAETSEPYDDLNYIICFEGDYPDRP
ncbi:phage tail protein [Sessilibacter sp. MAH2]